MSDTEKTEQKDDIKEDISRAYDEIMGASSADTHEDEAKKEEPNEESTEKTTEEIDEEEVGEENDQESEEESHEDARSVKSFAPRSWSKKQLEVLSKVPVEIKSEIEKILGTRDLQTTQSYSRAINKVEQERRQLQEVSKQYERLDSVLQPVRSEWAARGLSDTDAIAALVNAHKQISSDPAGAIKKLAANYKIDLAQLASGDISTAPDPRYSTLVNEINELKNLRYQQDLQQIQQHNEALVNEVHTFANETDTSGNLKYPLFERVSKHMKPLVAALQAEYPNAHPYDILAEAYDQAVYANRETREQVIRAQTVSRGDEAKKRAMQAKSRAVSVRGAPSAGQSTHAGQAPDTVRGAIEMAMAELGM